jgi:MYXO-CTERM domain-containing protein
VADPRRRDSVSPLDEVTSSSSSDDSDRDPGLWALVLLGVALTMVVGTLYVLLWRAMGRAVSRWAARRRGEATPEELTPLL